MTDYQSNNKTKPLVSAIIPAYNSEDHIRKTIESVQAQQIENIEILVYDDASSDSTRKIIQGMVNEDHRIKLYYANKNKGAGNARQFLLKKAQGQYIAFLDADDLWRPGKLKAQIEKLEQTGSDICVTGIKIINEQGYYIDTRIPPKKINFRTMHRRNYITTSSALFRSSLKGARLMPFIRKRQDYAYWLGLLSKNPGAKVEVLEEPLTLYLARKDSISSNKLDNIRWNYMVFRRYMKYSRLRSSWHVTENITLKIIAAFVEKLNHIRKNFVRAYIRRKTSAKRSSIG